MNHHDAYIREVAARQVAKSISPGERFVITGASGWLGRTFVGLLANSNVDLYLLGSRQGVCNFSDREIEINTFDLDEISAFKPTALFDFAFKTREYCDELGLEKYLQINNSLIDSAMSIFGLPTVKRGLFTSSGAATFPNLKESSGLEDNPYGYLKRKTEILVDQEAKRLGKRSLVIRPWSLSGPLTEKSDAFAFSSFIHQSQSGKIVVRSNRPVVRRYTSVDDYLAVSLSLLFGDFPMDEPFDSGGDLISALDLAGSIASACGNAVKVDSDVDPELEPDEYYSDNIAWAFACTQFGYKPETLGEQIRRNLRAIA